MTEINPEALRSAVQERIQLAAAATPGPWIYDEDNDDGHEAIDAAGAVLVHSHYPDDAGVPLGTHDGAFIAAHDPSFMLRVYRQWLDVLDRHQPTEPLEVPDDADLLTKARAKHLFCLGHERLYEDMPIDYWPCPEVRSVAAALGLNEEETPA